MTPQSPSPKPNLKSGRSTIDWSALTDSDMVDTIYMSVVLKMTSWFDATYFEQPQGKRVLGLIKDGIEDAVLGIPPAEITPGQVYALAVILLLTPAMTAARYGLPWSSGN